MKSTLIRLGILVVIFQSISAFAETRDLKPYLDFAMEWTPYAYNGQPLPKLKIERHAIVQIYAYGDLEAAQAESKGEELPVVNAIYVPEEKTIYVSDRFALDDPKLDVTLVHETVHYLQDISGYTQSVAGHLACTESDAYDVQMLYQKINNIEPETIPLVYQQSILASMKCMGNKTSAFGKMQADVHY